MPNLFETIPEVGGTVDNHKRPIQQLKAIIVKLFVGKINNKKMPVNGFSLIETMFIISILEQPSKTLSIIFIFFS